MIKRWLLRALLTVTLVLMLAVAGVTLLLATEVGSRWLLAQVSDVVGVEYSLQGGTLYRGLKLADVRYEIDRTSVFIDQAELAWRPGGVIWGVLTVEQLHLAGIELSMAASEGSAAPEESGPISWPDLRLPVKVVFKDVQIRDLHVSLDEQQLDIDRLFGRFDLGPAALDIDTFALEARDLEVLASGRAALQFPYDFALSIQLDAKPSESALLAQWLPQQLQSLPLHGELSATGGIDEIDYHLTLMEPLQGVSHGQFTTPLLSDVEPRLTAEVRLSEQTIPPVLLSIKDQPIHGSASVAIDGWLQGYTAELDVTAATADYPTVQASVQGAGDLSEFNASYFVLRQDTAKMEGTASVDWRDGVTWDVSVAAEGLNPGIYIAKWPGNFSAEFSSVGAWQETKQQISLELNTLDGELRGLQLAGQGGVDYLNGEFDLRQFQASLGANKLELNGHFGEDVDVDWVLAAPLLEQIDPAIGGQLAANGRLYGRTPDLHFNGLISANELRWNSYQVRSLTLESSIVKMAGPELAIKLNAQDVFLDGTMLSELKVDAVGSPDQHRVNIALSKDSETHLTTQLQGTWQALQWSGEVSQLSLTTPYTHAIDLAGPSALSLSTTEASVEDFCLAMTKPVATEAEDETPSESAQVDIPMAICGEGQWRANAGVQGKINVEKLALLLLEPWLRDDMDFAGYLAGAGELRWDEQEKILKADLQAVDASLLHDVSETEKDAYPLDALTLSVSGNHLQLNAQARAEIEEFGQLNAQAQYSFSNASVTGELLAEIHKLQPFTAFIPGVRNVEGRLNATVNLQGTLQQPDLEVLAELSDVSAEVPPLGIELRSFNARIEGDEAALNARGQALAGDGKLALTVEALRPLQETWQYRANLTGDNANVLNLPELQLWVTPNIELLASAEKIDIRGSAAVPRAKAVINTLPVSAVRLSKDVIVVDEPSPSAGKRPLSMDLQLSLGDEVFIDASGFTARLGGNMSLNKTPVRELYAVGDIYVIDGRYEAFGQNLSIERGSLSFQGPLDNPGLNITATRRVDDVMVGLIIGGTLQTPSTEIYSRPHQSESNAMSMLFTGKRLEYASSGEASMLINAVARLGVKRGQFLADDIASRFGLDELTIKSDDDVDASQLWLGKYLTEDLYIHYAIGLFDNISTMGFTYYLNDYFRVEAESGIVQSADIIFNMQR